MKPTRLIVLLALFAVFAACGKSDETGAPANTLQRGTPSDPETLDPHKARSVQAAEILRDLGEGLAGYSPDGELVPAADHFVAGMRRLVNPATAAFYAQMLVDIDNAGGIVSGDIPVSMLGVEAVDARTLVMRLVQPTPYLVSLLTHPSTFPVHPGSLAARALSSRVASQICQTKKTGAPTPAAIRNGTRPPSQVMGPTR